MATHDYDIANQSGAAFRVDLNNALDAIQSNNSNSSSPSNTVSYQWWADTSAGVMKIRNAANDGWIELFQLDGTLTLEDGSASAPALANRGDLDTGVFFGAANQFNIATGGTERLKIDSTAVVFNEGGADVDFRIEGDTVTHLFYVDAGNERIGIGTDSPDQILHISAASNPLIRVENIDNTLTGDQLIGGIEFEKQDSSGAGAGVVGGLRCRSASSVGNSAYLEFATASSSANNVSHMRLEDDGDLRLSSDDVASNFGFIDGWADSTGQMVIGSDHGTTGTGANNSDIIFKTRGGEKLRISHSGGITFNGDTASSNRLDDYEEGTYTPSFGYATDDGNKQYSTQTGSYTKIGRIVIVNIAVILTNAGTGSGQVTVSLPFTVADALASTSIEAQGTSGFFSGLTSSVSCITLLASHSSTNASIQKVSGTQAAATSALNQNNLGNAASFRFSLVYPAD